MLAPRKVAMTLTSAVGAFAFQRVDARPQLLVALVVCAEEQVHLGLDRLPVGSIGSAILIACTPCVGLRRARTAAIHERGDAVFVLDEAQFPRRERRGLGRQLYEVEVTNERLSVHEYSLGHNV
jgi:hypothetical protein